MRLVYDVQSGWPSRLTTIHSRIGALKRRSCAFKIGITNRPKTRMRQYEKSNPRHYSEMRVIYRTSSRRNAAELERQLVDRNWLDPRIRNEVGGGGGKPGAGKYYLYLVRRHRRNWT